jgi:hypothetical protein
VVQEVLEWCSMKGEERWQEGAQDKQESQKMIYVSYIDCCSLAYHKVLVAKLWHLKYGFLSNSFAFHLSSLIVSS